MRGFLYCFVCFFMLFGTLNAQDELGDEFVQSDDERPKIIYVKNADSKNLFNMSTYVGQTLRVTYDLLLFSNAKFVGTEFVGGIDSTKVVLKNPNTKWRFGSDGSYKGIYEYKIKSIGASIPPLKVMAVSSDGNYDDFSIAPAIELNVIDLYQNKKYAGVLADEFKIITHRTKIYDNVSNILVFEVSAKNSNLEDLKLPGIEKQGFESIHLARDSDGIYYCILPKEVQNISFEYFSLSNNSFQDIILPIVPVEDVVSTQDDIKPKNSFLLFSNLILIGLMVVILILYFMFKRKKIFLVFFLALLIYLFWSVFFSKHQAILIAQQPIRILPTHNSTILEVAHIDMNVEIISKHDQFYKIVTTDGKIGWIRKNALK